MTPTINIVYSTSSSSSRAYTCARRLRRSLLRRSCSPPDDPDGSSLHVSLSRVDSLHLPPSDDGWTDVTFPVRGGHRYYVFVVSTTGEGEVNPDLLPLWRRLLRKTLSCSALRGVRVAVYALGDRAYGEHFCAAGRMLSVRLSQLGSEIVHDLGFGDDSGGGGAVLTDLDRWGEKLGSALRLTGMLKVWNSSPDGGEHDDDEEVKYVEEVAVSVVANEPLASFYRRLSPVNAYHRSEGPVVAVVEGVESLTPVSAALPHTNHRNVCNITLSLPDGAIYRAGDVSVIHPTNSSALVRKVLDLLPAHLSSLSDEFLAFDDHPTWPAGPLTLREFLTHCADLSGPVDRSFLRDLSLFLRRNNPDAAERAERLRYLASPAGHALYVDYVVRERRAWPEILEDFGPFLATSAIDGGGPLLTLARWLGMVDPLRPREFSIASAPSERTGKMELCVGEVREVTRYKRTFAGACSSYLIGLSQGDRVHLWIRPGSFGDVVENVAKGGVWCIGNGTGMAPLRGLLRERMLRRARLADGSCDGCPRDVLAYGCRDPDDFLYRSEWEDVAAPRTCLAYSRLTDRPKTYVQHLLGSSSPHRVELRQYVLGHGGAIIVAGGSDMAREVRTAVLEALAEVVGGMAEARKLLKQMARRGKWAVEAW